MNRKISTLFTAGLLMAGSLCGSAFAQQNILDVLDLASLPSAATELKGGKFYLMTNSMEAYGFELDESTGKLKELFEVPNASPGTLEEVSDVQKYIWQVSVTENVGAYSYKFTNVATGKTLRINPTSMSVETDPAVADNVTKTAFVFGGNGQSTNKFTAPSAMFAYDGSRDYQLTWNASASSVLTSADPTKSISFYEVEGVNFVDNNELNDLYNGSGFTFESKRKDNDQKAEPHGNLFNEKRVTAVYLNNTVTIGGSSINGLLVDATDYPSYTGDAKEFYIPNGMYFFTENAPINANGTFKNDYKAWLNATIVVVSSTETIEATNAGRANGDGFALTEMKVSDLNFYQGNKSAWKTAGNEVSVNNANFTVKKSYTSNYPYELTLEKFRYRIQNSKADHTDAEVKLWVLKHSDDYYLTTTSNVNDPQNIFCLAPAGMKEGIELLNEEAKVAAFNIRVLSGDKNDIQSLYGKYLTNAVQSGSFNYVAKAKVLSQPETPAYQWAITSVDNKYNVTFTNRETSEHFTAGLFPKADLGENVYEMAIKDADDVTPIYVDENTYNEAVNTTNVKSMNALIVELIPSEIDPEAGFLNVDDKTLMTMAFARDVNETSNKWYAGVYYDGSSYVLNKNNEFSNTLSGAAQWQLVKNPVKKTIIERSFVYNKDGRVTVHARGDKAYAYEYQLQYVHDGKEMNKYFPTSSTGAVAAKAALVNKDAAKYIIKVAADGAVYLIESKATSSSAASIFDTNTHAEVRVVLGNNGAYRYATNSKSVYAWPRTSNDLLLKAYLLEEAPEISYPAKDGHISLVSEKGNYISVNDDREGIVVDKEQYTFYLQVTDEKAVVPSFYISKKGVVENGDRLFLFNPTDSVNYYVAAGTYDRKYQWAENEEKALFKSGTLVETKDTLVTVVKGNAVNVADKADDEGVLGGLDRFKVQIILVDDTDDQYYIRSVANSKYLYGINDKLAWVEGKTKAMKFTIPAGDPTSNESIVDAAESVKVIAGNGTVEIQGAAGKSVVITNVLGKVIASTVLTSDNATIAAPAGIIVVAVDGEAAVKAVVK